MQVKQGLFYTKTHEWVQFPSPGSAVIGVSDYAQHSLSDVVFITLPSAGEELKCGQPLGDVESVKAVSDIVSPVSGAVSEVNEDVDMSPELINNDPYGAWLVKVTDVTDKADLMDAAAYEAYCAELEEE